ncbi:MAG: Ig-like domain-containing protein [Gemmatimonadaceae bacterium]|nr:Ig-like domain-containing protein [Gemmatimonadaceae bacterium]
MVHRSLLRVAGTAIAALFIASCADYGPTDAGPLFRVTPNFATIEPGETRQLGVTLDGQPAEVTWVSSNPAVASVSSTGRVTGLTNGYTAVTASLNSNPTMLISSSITVPLLQGTAITPGTDLAIAGATGSRNLYRVRVNAGATSLVVRTSGGTGDLDLHVRFAQVPTLTANAGGTAGTTGCRPYLAGNNETCTFTNPATGSWYILLDGYEAYAGATLRATVVYP